ncbi:MAG: TlpA family protein disulfide reductase [Elusimicrobia bacterium]|nr:TlpA family protein disulfide reductase [Elusimicrobiota bacterium]
MPKKHLASVLVALVAAVTAFNLLAKQPPKKEEVKDIAEHIWEARAWNGRYPPDFETSFLDGADFKLSDAIGRKVLIVNFFSTTCLACRSEMPELSRFIERHRADPVLMIGLDADEKEEVVREFIRQEKLPFPVGIDHGNAIADSFRVRGRPVTVLIGADGKVAIYERGAIANADVVFESLVRKSLEIIERKEGIDTTAFVDALKRQAPLESLGSGPERGRPALAGRAKTFAARMFCPSCRKPMPDCRCGFCDAVFERLRGMKIDEGAQDEAVLRRLFLEAK